MGVQEVSTGFSHLQVSSSNLPLRQSPRIAATRLIFEKFFSIFRESFYVSAAVFPRTCNRHCELRDSRNDDIVSSTK